MTLRPQEAIAEPVVTPVTALIDAVLHDDVPAALAVLSERSIKREGVALFGMSALGVPLGLAANPKQIGLSMAEVGEEMAVAEVRGRDAQDEDVSVSTVVLRSENGAWMVDDIWPVPADLDFTVDVILEPTVMFYNGQMQLELEHPEEIDSADKLLLAKLQADGAGLHMLEQGLRFWHALRRDLNPAADVTAWLAATHMCVLALDGIEADPDEVAKQYGVPAKQVTDRFMEIARRLSNPEGEPAQPVQQSSGLVDPYGRPLPPSGGSVRPSGIILPGG